MGGGEPVNRTIDAIREDLDWALQELNWATENEAHHRAEAAKAAVEKIKWQRKADEFERQLIVAMGEPS